MKTKIIAIIATVVGGAATAQAPADKYDPCVDYFAPGGTRCHGNVATATPEPLKIPVQPPAASRDPVQDFLDNHGKPPREFAEFYVNPTPENARRWVTTFQAQQAKANALAQAWQQAEQASSAVQQAGPVPQSQAQTPSVNPVPAVPMVAPAPVAEPALGTVRLGAFAATPAQVRRLTYYFSASCPFCLRLKPELEKFTQVNKGKFVFTCVDLTPLSPRQTPAPSNRDGLPCDWRLPDPGEVERLQIRQTPTILAGPAGREQRFNGLVNLNVVGEALLGAR